VVGRWAYIGRVQMSTQADEQVDVIERGRWAAKSKGAQPRSDGSDLADLARSETSLRRFLHGLPGVDQVGADARAASLATRSIKAEAKLWAIDTAISMIDLTTLEGADTAGKVRSLCGKAVRPDPADPSVPPVAAVCVYPDLVSVARAALGRSQVGPVSPVKLASPEKLASPVKVASVATAFPSGRASMAVKLADVADAVMAGADEVDMVIDRGAFLSGHYGMVLEEVRAVKEACGGAHLKVILETGELATYDNVSRASWTAMIGGADFVKTSTGKVSPAATLPVALVMLEAVRDFADASGTIVGVKVAGGIRTTKDAIRYLVVVNEVAGDSWLEPDRFRIGASSLLNDLLMQRSKQQRGAYAGSQDFSVE
jgi:deoxyribose-phosphate aldolase